MDYNDLATWEEEQVDKVEEYLQLAEFMVAKLGGVSEDQRLWLTHQYAALIASADISIKLDDLDINITR